MSATPCRLIIDPPADGAWNMAVDEAILDEAVTAGPATLRFYQWREPTLSLGYFQAYAEREAHLASRGAAVVRRQSGGGAILHDHELTYSLTLPPGHPLTRDATALYRAVHQLIVALLESYLAAAGNTAWRLSLNPCESPLAKPDEPFLCFERRACGDLVLTQTGTSAGTTTAAASPTPTKKILGSAQRRHRGAILQHGSLLLARSTAAPELAGWNDLTGIPLAAEQVAADLLSPCRKLLALEPAASTLPAAIQEQAERIAQERYLSRSWTARR